MDNRCKQDWYRVVQSCLTVEACVFKIRIYQAQTGWEAEKMRKILNKKSHHSAMFILACMMDASNKQPPFG